MSLDASALASAIEGIGFPASASAAGEAYAQAYCDYAAGAEFHSAPALTPIPPDPLAATLGGGFAAYDVNAAAAAFLAGVTAAWLAPPILFSNPGVSVVSAIGGGLDSALLSAWDAANSGKLSRADAAKLIADALHAFTLTVIVTWTNPPAAPVIGPIS